MLMVEHSAERRAFSPSVLRATLAWTLSQTACTERRPLTQSINRYKVPGYQCKQQRKCRALAALLERIHQACPGLRTEIISSVHFCVDISTQSRGCSAWKFVALVQVYERSTSPRSTSTSTLARNIIARPNHIMLSNFNPLLHDNRPGLMVSCFDDEASFDESRYHSFIIRRNDEQRWLIAAAVNGSYEKHLSADEMQWNDDDAPKKQRKKKCVITRRTEDGKLELIKPTDTIWYLVYVNNPLVNYEQFQVKFRCPTQTFLR